MCVCVYICVYVCYKYVYIYIYIYMCVRVKIYSIYIIIAIYNAIQCVFVCELNIYMCVCAPASCGPPSPDGDGPYV